MLLEDTMSTINLKGLLKKFNAHLTTSFEGAVGLCVSRLQYEVTAEHVLLKLLENANNDLSLILDELQIDMIQLRRELELSIQDLPTGSGAKPVFSPFLVELVKESWVLSSLELNLNSIHSASFLSAYVDNGLKYFTNETVQTLSQLNSATIVSTYGLIRESSIETTSKQGDDGTGQTPQSSDSALANFCEDFTQKAKDGKIDPVYGRDNEIRQMIDIFARRKKNNPIVVGEAGVGKTAVVEGLALRIVENDVPDILKNVSLLSLDLGLLQAGVGIKGELENRLKSIIDEVKNSSRSIILFIDEAHTLIGSNGQQSDVANLLKPVLARGELRTVAATTWTEYKKYFEKDPALARRFQLVKLDPPSVETTKLILQGLKGKYEESHQVTILNEAIQAAAELSDKYISGRQLPDKAVDVLDTAAARVKVLLSSKPNLIENKERIIQGLDRNKASLVKEKQYGLNIDEDLYADICEQIEVAEDELQDLISSWQIEKKHIEEIQSIRTKIEEISSTTSDDNSTAIASLKSDLNKQTALLKEHQMGEGLIQLDVDANAISMVISDWTGIPLGNVMKSDAENILDLEKNLNNRVKGQGIGVSSISEVLKAAKTGVKDPSQPLGAFLLVGSSGIGKTETGIAVADLLFGGEDYMCTINMSEFQEKHTVSRLIGSPPGYVGYGEGGVLTEAVRKRPYSVVLVDEVEKGHLDVLNLFYQVFDKGNLNDGEGRKINFKNTVIFLTSNLATDIITEMYTKDPLVSYEDIVEAIKPTLSNHFKPALLARMTLIPYLPLSQEILKDIVALKLNKIEKRLMKNHKISFSYSDTVQQAIASRCTEVDTGARNIDYILNSTVMPKLAQTILIKMSQDEMPSSVYMDVTETNEFTFEYK